MADEKRVIGAEELELLNWVSIFGLHSGGGEKEGNVMAGVRVHDFVCTYRPINPLDLLIPRVLNHHRRRLRRLTVPHSLNSNTIPSACVWDRSGLIFEDYTRWSEPEIMIYIGSK